MMTKLEFLEMLKKFQDGRDRSMKFAWQIEVELLDLYDEVEPFESLASALALYRPGGGAPGEYLYDDKSIMPFVGPAIVQLEAELVGQIESRVHGLAEAEILSVQQGMDRIGARCKVATKVGRGRWTTVAPDVETLAQALTLAKEHANVGVVVGILLVHETFGGIILWDSSAPAVINDLSRLE